MSSVMQSAEHESLLPLEARGLKLQIGGHTLINGINLTLSAGQISVIMGANGAGKTVLLRLLHGLQQPTSGEVLWGGKPIGLALRKRQAMVFQKPVLLSRSVEANMDFVFRLSGQVDPDRRDEMLDQVDLLKRAKQPARLLSGGEQQRLALARALATDPEVLFLDEPTASLDPASTFSIENTVKSAHERGIKVVFVTHDVGQARRLADEIVFLHCGQLVEQSNATKFFLNPSSDAAKAYLEGRILL